MKNKKLLCPRGYITITYLHKRAAGWSVGYYSDAMLVSEIIL